MRVPYNLDEIDLSYIEQTLHNQMMYNQYPLTQIRSASMGPEVLGNYKAKISSLLGGKTKGSTSGKENYEDMNNYESPLFDAELEEYYENGKHHYMLTEEGELVQISYDNTQTQSNSSSSSGNQEDEKLKKKREKRKEQKKRRKLKKQAEKTQEELSQNCQQPTHSKLKPEVVIA
jgi:hypothetical protein